MKKLLLATIVTFFAFTSQTNAATTDMCYNFGHDILSGDVYNYSVVDQQLKHLTDSGVKCLRLAYIGYGGYTPDYLSGNRPDLKLAKYIKSVHPEIRLIIGGDFGTMRTSDYTKYDNNVIAQAKWAQANGIEQVSLGNEQEYRLSGISKSSWASHLRSLATKVRKVYSGNISYETSGDFVYVWENQSRGDISQIGINLYCGLECNKNFLNRMKVRHAGHVYISEINADMNTGWYADDAVHAAEVRRSVLPFLNEGVYVYYFAFAANGNSGVNPHWGLYNGATIKQPKTAAALGLQ